jgi:hypothetical protein
VTVAPTPAQRDRRRLTLRARQVFLDHLAAGWTVRHAAAAAGVARRQTLYEARERDPEFTRAWDEALEAGVEALLDEARRRAVEGWERPVYQGRELVGHVREYDSKLLMFLIAGRDPRYRGVTAEVGNVTYILQSAFQPAPGNSLDRSSNCLDRSKALELSAGDVLEAEIVEGNGDGG